jgi:carbamoyl-phosphate synthase small subunit
MQTNAQLVLKSGEIFYGHTPTALTKPAFGEVVFTTGMVGYVESLTDPSYAGQILVFTYPLIGNYGVSAKSTWESEKIHVRGVVVSEIALLASHHTAQQSIFDWLQSQSIPLLTAVDTRALTKCLREHGVLPGAIAPLNSKLTEFEDFEEVNWVEKVSINIPTIIGTGEKTIVAIDCGMKNNILRELQRYPVRIIRVPYDYDFTAEPFDGVFISNGPGDPARYQKTVEIIRKAMQLEKPIFGICLGTQLMALAAGAKTYKLPFGHRSHNQPCLHLPTQRSYLTSQNHGYAVAEQSLPSDWEVSFRHLNDQSVAGIQHRSLPFFSVQFHPEAAPGPEDTKWLFEQFYEAIQK